MITALMMLVSPAFAATSGADSVPVMVTYLAQGGTIDAGGLYTAGSSAGTYRVIASAMGGKLADTASVTIAAALPRPSSIFDWRDASALCGLAPLVGVKCELPKGKSGKPPAEGPSEAPVLRPRIGFDDSLLRRGVIITLLGLGTVLTFGLWLGWAGRWGVYRDVMAV